MLPKVLCGALAFLLLVSIAGCAPTPPQIQETSQCSDKLGCITIAPGKPVKIGVLQTLSGGAAPGGLEQKNSIELTIAGRKNELLGHPIVLLVEDENCSAEGGANAALRIVADPQVVGILGTNCSSAAVTAGKIMSEKGLVMISSSNTSPSLTSLGGKQGQNWVPGYYRTAWNDSAMGRTAAVFAYEKLGIRKAAVISAGDAYSKGLADIFTQVFHEQNGDVVLEATIDEEDQDQSSMLDAVVLAGAEMIFFPLSRPETGSRIVRQARAHEALKDIVLIGGDSMLSDVFIRETGAAGVGVYMLGPAELKSEANEAFREQYKARYGAYPPAFYYSFAYDSTSLLLQAVEKSALKDEDGTLHIGRQSLRDAITATQGFPGLTGHLSCDSFGDCGMARLNILQLDRPDTTAEAVRSNIVYTYSTNP